MKTLNYSIPYMAMVAFIVIASVAACIAAYFYIFQTGIGEIGLHNQFIAEIAGIVAFTAGIIACVFAFPYQNELRANGREEDASPTVLILIIVVSLVMTALLGFSVYNNMEDQKSGPVNASEMNFISKTHVSSFITKNVSTSMISPKVRLVFSGEDGKMLSFFLTNQDYKSLFDDIEFETDTKYEIEYYPNSCILVSIS